MSRKAKPTIESLRRAVEYDPGTGTFKYQSLSADDFEPLVITPEQQAQAWNRRFAGKPAVFAKQGDYISGTVRGFRETAHRMAFAVYYGRWPTGEIDHINGDTRDNRIANLRDVEPIINKRNRKLPCTNSSGVPGVRWEAKNRSWVVTIGGRETRQYIGTFKVFDEAVSARKQAERRLDYHANHGRTSNV